VLAQLLGRLSELREATSGPRRRKRRTDRGAEEEEQQQGTSLYAKGLC